MGGGLPRHGMTSMDEFVPSPSPLFATLTRPLTGALLRRSVLQHQQIPSCHHSTSRRPSRRARRGRGTRRKRQRRLLRREVEDELQLLVRASFLPLFFFASPSSTDSPLSLCSFQGWRYRRSYASSRPSSYSGSQSKRSFFLRRSIHQNHRSTSHSSILSKGEVWRSSQVAGASCGLQDEESSGSYLGCRREEDCDSFEQVVSSSFSSLLFLLAVPQNVSDLRSYLAQIVERILSLSSRETSTPIGFSDEPQPQETHVAFSLGRLWSSDGHHLHVQERQWNFSQLSRTHLSPPVLSTS